MAQRVEADGMSRDLRPPFDRTVVTEVPPVSAAHGNPHDFKNVLAGIVGCADLAMTTLSPDHPARQYLDALKRSALDAAERVDGDELPPRGHDRQPFVVGDPGSRLDRCTGTALVVEDEPLVRMSVRYYLERQGYEVLVARNAEEGTALVSTARPLDVLVVDMVLPDGGSGFEVAMAARRARPDLDIVCMSALPPQALVRAGHVAPGTRILQKPFAEQELVAALRRAHNEPAAAP